MLSTCCLTGSPPGITETKGPIARLIQCRRSFNCRGSQKNMEVLQIGFGLRTLSGISCVND
jgi:hypothetical protein